ncbi:CBS domain-containing protein [Streptomyces sp. RPT161]|uniref:CBS domain-containing protein n=1 Tax=Streptomyces sp. RPT161 TaxID=3015993 RepID=UPI0022B907BE|nr:CBS domain-containing protein [Streptomyces sp. RPT161]
MTLVQTHPSSADTSPMNRTAVDATEAVGPQVWDAMTVEVALSLMAAARTGHLVICDEDGQCTGLVTLARLTAVRDSSRYTDRLRLRDIADGLEPFASPLNTTAEAEHTMRHRPPGTLPVAEEHSTAPDVLALSR